MWPEWELDIIKSREDNILVEENIVLPKEKKVDSECQFSTDPCHFCTEYCSQIVSEGENHRHVIKLKSQHQSKKIVSDEQTSAHPMCKFASKPCHECAACFFQNDLDQNIVTKSKGSKKLPADKRRNHKICVESDCTGALDAGSNVESHEGIILQKDTKKNNMKSKFVELSSPDYNHVEFSKRIAIVDGNNVPEKEVEMKNPKGHSDVQPSHINAPDFLIEWAKYCSQGKADEYKIVVQDKTVEGREFSAKDDKEDANSKIYNSSKFQKVSAEGSSQAFLPTSLLFFVGFVFTLFYWTQSFHSVVSERRKKYREDGT